MAISRKARIGLIAFVLLASTPIGAFDLKLKSSRWTTAGHKCPGGALDGNHKRGPNWNHLELRM